MRTNQQHAVAGGAGCPVCESLETEGGSVDTGDGSACQSMSCNNCGSTWLDSYTIDGYTLTEDGTANTKGNDWMICPECRGEGKHAKHMGALSQDDLDQDPDFAEDYMNGVYDRMCDCCNGTGKIRQKDYVEYSNRAAQAREDYRMACREDGRPCDL